MLAKCEKCKVLFYWIAKRGRKLRDVACPSCGKSTWLKKGKWEDENEGYVYV